MNELLKLAVDSRAIARGMLSCDPTFSAAAWSSALKT